MVARSGVDFTGDKSQLDSVLTDAGRELVTFWLLAVGLITKDGDGSAWKSSSVLQSTARV
jgi:hypothetical protein